MRHEWPIVEVETPVVASLRKTLAYLEEHGWCQNKFKTAAWCCVGYALNEVGGGISSPAANRLREVTGWTSLIAWNDSGVSDFAQVREAFRKAMLAA